MAGSGMDSLMGPLGNPPWADKVVYPSLLFPAFSTSALHVASTYPWSGWSPEVNGHTATRFKGMASAGSIFLAMVAGVSRESISGCVAFTRGPLEKEPYRLPPPSSLASLWGLTPPPTLFYPLGC